MPTIYYNEWLENKSLKVICENIPIMIKKLTDEHGKIEGLQKIHITIMQNDTNDKIKNRYNVSVNYPVEE